MIEQIERALRRANVGHAVIKDFLQFYLKIFDLAMHSESLQGPAQALFIERN